VFWVHASNAARFEQSFRDIANCVKISGRQNPQANNIFQLVYDWLRSDRKGKWVLILDNVDDAGFLVKAQSTGQDGQTNGIGSGNLRPLVAYLPQCSNGSILITTRSESAALKLVEQRDIIVVKPMGRADALALLERKLGWHDNGEDAVKLAAALEFMPLAIVQAAAYISQRAPRYSVREYLQDFRKSDRKRTSLLDHEGEQLRRDWGAKNSIIITWQISFDYIQEIRPSAADLLSLMSFFDRQGIPEALLRSRNEQRNSRQDQKEYNDDISYSDDDDEDDISKSSISDGFEEDILALRDYSFITINADGTTFEMHGLVQLATRKWLEAHKQQERWQQQFIRNLYAEFPNGEYENWAVCQALFPHAKSAAAQQPKEQDTLRDWASILYKAAWYAWGMGNGVEAEEMSVQAMQVRRKILGREDEDTLDSTAMIGLAYNLRGRWDRAEKLQVEVMETRKKKLGPEHSSTLTSMNNLASTYSDQGRWEAAEELFVQVMQTCKKKLGANHRFTLGSMNNLSVTYRHQGRWNEAEKLDLQAIEISKKKLGADHPDTLTSMGNLASTYTKQGRWEAAEELFVQVIETRKKELGADHLDTLGSMNNLSVTYKHQGRWNEARKLDLQVMETSKKKLGADHPSTLTSMANLASTYQNQGRWDAAEELEVQVVETTKKKLGDDHPSTLTSMANLASTYRNQGRWDAAEELEVQVMETTKKKFGADHPSTLISIVNLAFTWKGTGKETEAVRLMEEYVQSRKRVLGLNYPHSISSCTALDTWKAEQEDVVLSVQSTRDR
jgi:hypothetical protein